MSDRPTSDPKQFIQGAPVLQVADVKATAAYYRDILGFKWDFAMRSTPSSGATTLRSIWREVASVPRPASIRFAISRFGTPTASKSCSVRTSTSGAPLVARRPTGRLS